MYGCVFHKEDGFCEKLSDDSCKSYCVMGPCQYAIPSNADRIRTMDDVGLAAWYCHGRDCRGCEFGASDGCHLLDWLKSPVEVDNG